MTVRIEREGNVGVIVIDNPPVNASSHSVRQGLMAAVGVVESDPEITAAVIIGAGKTFVAGADIREFDQPLAEPQMPAVISAIVDSAKPFVAALHGSALGGGFELALACDVRIAAPNARVGLPEVTLGMIPGAGGTQHVPRLVGVAAAIEIVTSGRRIPAGEALELGLIDHLCEGDLRQTALEYAIACLGCKRRLRDLPVPADAPGRIATAEAAALAAAPEAVQVREAIAAVKSAVTTPYPEALAREREVFQRLRTSDEAAELRRRFFAERAAARRKP